MPSSDVHMVYNADTLKGVTMVVHVKPTLRYRVRVRIALCFVWMASRIAGYDGIEVRNDGEA